MLMRKTLKKALGKKEEQIEFEIFAHGAMCLALSGRCLISQYQFGKSGNRGECLQPGRREYLITDKDEKYQLVVGSDYVLSPQDLCTMPFLEKIMAVGIHSLKIEGRNRSPPPPIPSLDPDNPESADRRCFHDD